MPHDNDINGQDHHPSVDLRRAEPPSEEHAIATNLPPISGGAAALIGVVLLALFGGLFLLGWLPQSRRLALADSEAAQAAGAKTVVDTTTPKVLESSVGLDLPADVRAFQATAVYARTSGYLKPLPEGIDIGAHVKEGQVIAEIASPEVDADLDQARASLEQSRAAVTHAKEDVEFNKSTFERYQGFSSSGGLTVQQLDERRQQYNTASTALLQATANQAASAAAVKRLEELKSFEKIAAPFDGVITSRQYDAGALISVSNTGPGRELFQIAQTATLRVFVNVPQAYTSDIKLGSAADLTVSNFPGEAFPGSLARTTESIDPDTRTLRVEIDVPNAQGRLLPGMYGKVRFHIAREHPSVTLPTATLMFDAQGMRIAAVEDGRIRFHPITIGRDFGSEAEVLSGVGADAQVVINPGERLTDGAEVSVRASQGAQPKESRR